MCAAQLNLFADGPGKPARTVVDDTPPEFIERIRAELNATLARARGADVLPWRDLTRATIAELRFKSIAGWLPEDEAVALRKAFAVEMARLYEIADRAG